MRAALHRFPAVPVLSLAAAFLLSFSLYRAFGAVYTAVRAQEAAGDGLRHALEAELPATVLLFVTALSPFTRFCRPVLALGCAWRGAALGCLCGLFSSGRLPGPPPVRTVLFASLSALVFLRIAAAADAAHPALIAGGPARRYLGTALVFAGAHFLCDAALTLSF